MITLLNTSKEYEAIVLATLESWGNWRGYKYLAHCTKINRGKLYRIIKNLEKKGLVEFRHFYRFNGDYDTSGYILTQKFRDREFRVPISKKIYSLINKPLTGFITILFLLLIPTQCPAPMMFNKIEWVSYKQMVDKRRSIIEESEFTPELFFEYSRLVSVPNKKIVMSQSFIETGFFRSDIFIENNNLFGMKEPRVRETLATGTNRNHATYDHWTHSVIDYILWYQYMTRNKSYESYYEFLVDIGYAEDPDYISKLKIYTNNFNFERLLAFLQ